MDLRSEQIPSKDGKYNGQKYWSNANYKHDLKLDDNGMHNASDNHAGNMTTFISVPSSSAQQNYSGRPHKQETIRDSQKNRLHTYNSSNRRQNSSFENCYDVYNNSSTAFEFIDNLGRYLSSRIPPYCSIAIATLLALLALAMILTGIFNLQDCPSNPMIPTYLIVMGCLFIIWAVVRGFACCSSARENTSLGADLLCKLIEGFLLVSFIAWLLIGCFWIFGPKQYQYTDEYHNEYYCNTFLYWVACITVILPLLIIFLGLLSIAFSLCFNLMKDSD